MKEIKSNEKITEKIISFPYDGSNFDLKYFSYIGNGFLAMKMYAPFFYQRGLFNGKLPQSHSNNEDSVSHRAKIPNYMEKIDYKNITPIPPSQITFSMMYGMFSKITQISTSNSKDDDLMLIEQYYAHRKYKNIIVLEIHTEDTAGNRKKLNKEICFKIYNSSHTNDLDITQLKEESDYVVLKGVTKEVESGERKEVLIIKPKDVQFCSKFDDPFRYMLMVSSEEDLATMEANYVNYMSQSTFVLYKPHVYEWRAIWQGGVQINGNDTLSFIVQGAQYYILASLEENKQFSTSQVSLSSNDFFGHTMWYDDFYIFPSILPFFPANAKSMLNYRLHGINEAKQKAKKLGKEGILFPHECAFSEEECSSCKESVQYEHHVTGDVSFAFELYSLMRDLSDEEKKDFYEVFEGVADFWVSRATKRNGTIFDIKEVLSPDKNELKKEKSFVNNSVFVNALAQHNLDFATFFASIVKEKPKSEWKEVGDNLYFPTDGKVDLEYEGYNGDPISEADVILSHFPLGWEKAQVKNNLKYYQTKLDANSTSGLTWSNHAIQWLDLKDHKQGVEFFYKTFEPFVVYPCFTWSELPEGKGAFNYIAGAAALLNTIIYGFAGLRINRDDLSFNPSMIPKIEEFVLYNIAYKNVYFDMHFTSGEVTIKSNQGNLLVFNDKIHYVIKEGNQKSLDFQNFSITPQ